MSDATEERDTDDRGLIRVIILDIDGCLNTGVHAPYDLEAIRTLRDLNADGRTSDTTPQLTLCSGRPQPYVAAMAQFLHLDLPALCEHGGLLFSPRDDAVVEASRLFGFRVTTSGLREVIDRQVDRLLAAGTLIDRNGTLYDDS